MTPYEKLVLLALRAIIRLLVNRDAGVVGIKHVTDVIDAALLEG